MKKTFFILILLCIHPISYSQTLDIYSIDPVSLQKDSLLASLLVKGMNDSVAYSDTSDGKNLGSAGIEDGYFTYAPDNSFKILSISGFFCGAYCNPDYYNYFFYSVNGKETIFEMTLGDVWGIYQINHPFSGKEYLIHTRTSERPRGTETIQRETFYHLRIIGTGFNLVPIILLEDNQSDLEYSFSVEESVFCSNDTRPSKLKYERFIRTSRNNKTINFQTFDVHEYDLDEDDQIHCTIRAGKFLYIKGSFVEKATLKKRKPALVD